MTEAGHRVVLVGAGFGGLEFARKIDGLPVRLTVIDQRNHHLFQPLLYQVAASLLAASEIAWPIRHLLRRRRNATTLLAEVVGVDTAIKRVLLKGAEPVSFDTLVIATGARHSYFGHDEWEAVAPGLKTLEDAIVLRRKMLAAFEQAELEPDPARREGLLTFVVVGGGPTGVEMAGTIAELKNDTLAGEFRRFDPREAKVVLVEAGPRVLGGFRSELSDYARRSLEELGVTVELGRPVENIDPDGVTFGGARLPARTVIWAAGVAASPVAKWLDAPADRVGRVLVEPDLTAPGHPDIFVIGDAAHVEWTPERTVPGIAPAAKQQGRHAAAVLKARLKGDMSPKPFRYRHSGDLATIGKRRAVIDFGRIRLTGRLAWVIWGVAHIYFLIELRSRLAVALSWMWIYWTGRRSARLITRTGLPRDALR
ncbi:MAG TPA: NAD(P)/FAD-dependent oxidoreductase [Mesorhizobium sp.]|jgi:NADH dehydrogenase|nr:NAD(P)/FAD-dependent oxidoreductase [Mesorhizobium sp.]